MPTRVGITGLAVVSPIGLTVDDFWKSLVQGRSGIGPITSFDCSDLAVKIAAEVKDFDPTDYLSEKDVRRLARFTQFAVSVAASALTNAGLEVSASDAESIGIVMNTGTGGAIHIAREEFVRVSRGVRKVSPFLIPLMSSNMASAQAAIHLGIRGPTMTSVGGCAAGSMALYEALRMIRYGDANVVIAGGTESVMHPLAIAGFDNMRALSHRNEEPRRASRPFDRDRDGFVYGEGAAALVVESFEHAERRGGTIICELAGAAVTSDAYHITRPDPAGRGAMLAMRRALEDACMDAGDIDYICAHGTGTPLNDVAETRAIKGVFGQRVHEVPVSAIKSMIGHTLGAAGALSAVATVLAMTRGTVPPTVNLDIPDPECDLDLVPHVSRACTVDAAMVNAFAFGGQNAVLVFRSARSSAV
jgi:3-oxoacyl-[acyl-carrier-protein] synthase II